ncbi:hypothetical protein [Nonomuraea jabiensis]|uniref:hypothetical protein n=1 Tax=Nonomuraea jabiensis TaxID=882448 RepID=UPI003D7368BA
MAADRESPPEGILVDGNGTWLVPIVRGWSSRSDADAEAYLIANNHTSEKGGWEERMLAEVLADVRDADPDLLAATGCTPDDLARLAAADDHQPERTEELPEPGNADEDVRPEVWGIIVTCDNEDEQTRLLECLADEGLQVRTLI